MNITHLDHLVITTSNIDALVDFYTNYLNMKVETFDKHRVCLRFGQSKINLHSLDEDVDYKATNPSSGSMDICLIVEEDISSVKSELEKKGLSLASEIVERTGAVSRLKSIYLKDPDGNLIELSNRVSLVTNK